MMRYVVLPLVVLALFAVTVSYAGVGAGAVVVGGLAFIAATSLYPPGWVRVLGALYFALVTLAMLHHLVGLVPAVVIAAGLAAAAWRWVPLMAHKKIAFMVPSMVFLIYVTTLLMYQAPGSPFASEKAATASVLEAKASKFKIYKDPNQFFLGYMTDLVTEGSLGLSVKSQGRTVNELLMPALPVSASLGLLAMTIALALGLTLGVRAGLKPNSLADYSSMGLALIGISLPNFVIGALLLILFSLKLGWLPVAGWGSFQHLVLPAITLALPYAAYIARLARGGTIEVMRQDYIRTARAKGLPERVVVLKHALKGAILPVVSFLGPAAAGIMTGSFVVETLFGIPGMGRWFVTGATDRDYSVVLGTALIYFGLITVFNMLVDLAYSWIDPRTRTEAS